MSAKQVTGAILNMIFRLSISCIIIVLVYRLAMYSYHFGYMVFADASKEISPGRDITISVEMGDSPMDVANTLEKRGLIDDAKIFYAQELLSEYHNEINPGIYTLNTSMKANDMLSIMAKAPEETEDGEQPEASEALETTDESAEESETEETSKEQQSETEEE